MLNFGGTKICVVKARQPVPSRLFALNCLSSVAILVSIFHCEMLAFAASEEQAFAANKKMTSIASTMPHSTSSESASTGASNFGAETTGAETTGDTSIPLKPNIVLPGTSSGATNSGSKNTGNKNKGAGQNTGGKKRGAGKSTPRQNQSKQTQNGSSGSEDAKAAVQPAMLNDPKARAKKGSSTQMPPLRVESKPGAIISLGQAFNEGLMQSPRVSAIRYVLGITKSELIRATEMANPTIFMDNGYRAEFTYRYGFTIPLEMPWKFALRVALAKNLIKQTDLEIIRDLWFFRANVRRAYTELVVAQELLATLREMVDLTDQLKKISSKRFEAGEVAELDVYRAEQEAYKALADEEQQKYRVNEAKQALAVILGRMPTAEIDVPRLPPVGPSPQASGILPGKAMPALTVCLQEAMANRPELKVVNQAIRTNGASLKLALGNITPNPTIGVGSSHINGPSQNNPVIGINPSAESGNSEPEALERVNYHGFFFQVFQELPLLNFQQGDISKYRATGRQLKAELAAQENIITSEVVTSYQRLAGARKKIEIYQTNLLQKTIEIARLARLGYEVGQSDINATLLAQQATIQIKTEYLHALSVYQDAYTDLERSMGTVLQ